MIKPIDNKIKLTDYAEVTAHGTIYSFPKLLEDEYNFRGLSMYGSVKCIAVNTNKFNKFIENNTNYTFEYCHLFHFDKYSRFIYINNNLKIAFYMSDHVDSHSSFINIHIDNKYNYDNELKLKIDSLLNEIKKKCSIRKSVKPQLTVVTEGKMGYENYSKNLTINKLFSLNDHYNNDINNIYPNLIKRLNTKNDKGLVLLHGKPGTGKTSFIRHICSKIKNKKVIFLSPAVASNMTNPGFMTYLVENSNSVIIIEDAENLLESRDDSRSSAISSLLNISDGLLSDILNIQFICTFNCPISKIDNALLRKGRIIAKYEFKELELEKTKKLLSEATKPMTLAEIFNDKDEDFSKKVEVKTIGFSKI